MAEDQRALSVTDTRTRIVRLLILLAVIALTIYIFSIRDQAQELARYGYPGLFILNVLASATILLPAPGVAVVFAFGGVFNPFWVGVIAGGGATIGELSAYAAGYSGRAVVENASSYARLLGWMQGNNRSALLVLLLMAIIPNPLFDVVGIAAGALKIRLEQFLAVTTVGKIIKMWIFAYAGFYSVDWFINVF